MRPTTTTPRTPRLLAAALALALPACGHSEAAMQTQRDRARVAEETSTRQRVELERRARDAEARNRALADAVRDLGGNVQALTTERQGLATSVNALEAERTALRDSLRDAHQALDAMRAREAQAQARAQLFRGMVDRFRSMIDAGQLRVRVARNRMVVELPEGVLFDTGRAALKPTGSNTLEQVAEVLRAMERDFQVAGHTDNVPIHNALFASNWELSSARSLTVTHFLLDHGMAPGRLSNAGYAETQPTADNTTPDGRQQNRRIEIVLLPALDELPDLSALQDGAAPPPR